jgi:hypothetical protein
MARKINTYQVLFLLFLLIAFALGCYVYATMDLKYLISKTEGMESEEPEEDSDEFNKIITTPIDCPDVLIQRGSYFYLYNTRDPIESGVNPLIFNSLDEYNTHLESLNDSGKKCPPLFLQQENNAQGEDVYRMRPGPENPFAGVPAESPLVLPPNGKIVKELDASRDHGYNQNMYAGFDPNGLFVGRFTEVDKIHYSTQESGISDNPMDPNWGGILYTQDKVDSGKYIENEIIRRR